MIVEWEQVGDNHVDLWATTVGEFRLNVVRAYGVQPFKWAVAEVDALEVSAEGCAKDLEAGMFKAIAKARELSAT